MAARAACMQGDNDEGLQLAGQAVRIERAGGSAGLIGSTDAWAFALVCRQDFLPAIASYRDCLDLALRGGRELEVLRCRHNLAWALLCAGDADEADRQLAECLPPLLSSGPRGLRTAALHTHGAVRLMKGDVDAAEEAFVRVLRDTPADRHEAAYPVEALAIVAAHRGDHARAVRLRSAASEMRRRTGVPAEADWRRQIDDAVGRSSEAVSRSRAEELAASGRRLRGDRLLAYAAKSKEVEHPLTPREMEIAGLVAEGLTNRQIASRLRLATGTVSFHLNHVRDKLGVRTRTQIALWLVGFVTSSSGDRAVDVGSSRSQQSGYSN